MEWLYTDTGDGTNFYAGEITRTGREADAARARAAQFTTDWAPTSRSTGVLPGWGIYRDSGVIPEPFIEAFLASI